MTALQKTLTESGAHWMKIMMLRVGDFVVGGHPPGKDSQIKKTGCSSEIFEKHS